MNERLLKAKEEGRLVKLTFDNDINVPLTLAVNRANTKLVTNHKAKEFELHFITRRSTLNPGEAGKIYLITEAPLAEYEETAYLKFMIGELPGGIWWCLPLNGEEVEDDYRDWLKKKKQEAKS